MLLSTHEAIGRPNYSEFDRHSGDGTAGGLIARDAHRHDRRMVCVDAASGAAALDRGADYRLAGRDRQCAPAASVRPPRQVLRRTV
jgi:hypothetical protein